MTSDEFRDLLDTKSDEQLLDPCLREDIIPFVFEPRPRNWDDFRDALVSDLNVARTDIRVVGSGRFGFSMKPEYNLRGFRDTSDIDVLIVNASLFDRLWISLLTAAYPRPPLTYRLGGWLENRRRELYTGWLDPREIHLEWRIVGVKAKPALDFKTQWFNAFKRASRYPPRRHEDVKGRLYRTWRHAELYHLHSLQELRRSFADED